MYRYVNSALFIIFIVSLISCLSNSQHQYNTNTNTLELVHVIFRHGNRAVDENQSYPNDPYINETYYPFGLGQLTNKGKNTEYLLGKLVRKRYNEYLGPIYFPETIDPISTDYNRTKMSLELFLAGLYPPKGTIMEWERELNWQPIPYNYIETLEEHLFSIPIFYCPRYIKLYKEYLNSTEGIALDKKYAELFKYLSKHTGSNVTSLLNVLLLHVTLVAEADWGFKLPKWTEKVYPKTLDKASGDFFKSSSSTAELKQLSGGFLLKKLIEDTRAKITNNLKPPNRKMFIYSAHDINVAYILSALNVFYPHEPVYGSCVLIEVHNINNIHGIKIYYQNYEKAKPMLLKVPGCEYFCPFDQFVQLLKQNLPKGSNPCEDEKSNDDNYIYSRRIFHL